MKYQTLTLSEDALETLVGYDEEVPLNYEDRKEIKRALQFIKDEKKLEANKINEVPLPKGTVTLKGI